MNFSNYFNNTTRKLLQATLLGAFALLLVNCNRVLDKKPLDAISEDAVFSDAVSLQSYVYNIYNGIRPPWSPGTGSYDALTDIAVSQPETHDRAAGIRQYLEGNISPDNVTNLTNIWTEEYSYIRKANIFFEKIASSPIEKAVLDPMKGEVHFLRAWMYFELIRTYGGVPIITESFKLDQPSFDVPRNTYAECANFVLEEVESALTLLPTGSQPAGKISRTAALGLKARMLLYMASPLNNPTNDMAKWQAAADANKAVIDAGGFSLHATHADLFLRPLKTDEIIFGKQFTPGTRIPDWGYNYDYWPSGFDARQRIMPTQKFVNMFQLTNGEYPYQADGITVNPASGYDPQNPNVNRDPRYYSSVIFPGGGPFTINDGAKSTVRTYEYWEDANPNPNNVPPYANPNTKDPRNNQNLFDFGRDSKTYWVKGLTPFHWRVQTGYTFRRLLDFAGPRASYDYDYNQVVPFMRLPEFYLNYAEALIALGNEPEARIWINKVRKRPSVNMPDITTGGADLVRDYRNERAIELHLEDMRWFDLMRWKAAPGNVDITIRGLTSVTMDWTGVPAGDQLGKFTFTYGTITAAEVRNPWKGDYYYLLPIPADEIRRSNNVLVQNPGYQ
jgi:hypothetical protein